MEQERKETLESFAEDLEHIAERVKAERESDTTAERVRSSEKEELGMIRRTLEETYVGDGVTEVIPPRPSATDKTDYLDGIEEEYRGPVAEYVQEAITGGIASAIAKAQKENNPYLMDIFHDALAFVVHEKMREQGLLV